MRLQDRIAIVTGAARGIGRAIAKAYVREGAKVVLADIDAELGAEAAVEVSRGGEATFVACDVGDRAQVENLMAETIDMYGGIDVLVNNAGIIHGEELLDLSEDDFDRVLRVNLKGPFLAGQAAARQMVARGRGGAIVNMSSVNAILAIGNQIPYSISKGGVMQLTRVMSIALAEHNIRVNAIGPGTIDTDMGKTVMQDEAARRTIMSRTPLGRIGKVEEIAAVALFLASDESSYITGQTIYVDGGRLPLNYTVPVRE
ncbi:MAG: SDR family NAD(P)-dependent oxidoreductase [Alphaproteobacteria bacterium]